MKYTPETCITAGELRALGFTVQDDVPDCAWVPKYAIRPTCDGVKVGETEKGFEAVFNLETTEPFRWIEMDLIIK